MWPHIKQASGGVTSDIYNFLAGFTFIKLLSIIYIWTAFDKDIVMYVEGLNEVTFFWPTKSSVVLSAFKEDAE